MRASTSPEPEMREEGRGARTPTAQGSKTALLLKRAMPVFQQSAGEPLQSTHPLFQARGHASGLCACRRAGVVEPGSEGGPALRHRDPSKAVPLYVGNEASDPR